MVSPTAAAVEGDHGRPKCMAFEQGHAEALVLRQTEEGLGAAVRGHEIALRHLAGEGHVAQPQVAGKLVKPTEVALVAGRVPTRRNRLSGWW
jgi:hypothetical protein